MSKNLNIAASPSPAPYLSTAWRTAIFLSLANCIAYIDRNVISFLLEPIKLDLGLTDTQVGLVGGLAFAIFFTTMAYPIAWAADRHSRKLILGAGIFVWTAMTWFSGLAKSFTGLFLARVGVGAGEASLTPAAHSMLSDLFPPEKMNTAMSLFIVGASVGTALSFIVGAGVFSVLENVPSLSVPILGDLKSWQVTFLIVGTPGLLLLMLLPTFGEPPRKVEASLLKNPNPDAGGDIAETRLWGHMLRNWQLYASAYGGLCLYNIAGMAMLTWYPAFMMRVHEWSPSQTGFLTGIALLVTGPLGAVVCGRIADKAIRNGNRTAHLPMMGWWNLLLAPCFIIVALSTNPFVSVIMFVIGLFFTPGPAVLAPTFLQMITPGKYRARVSAIYIILTMLVGASIGPTAVGALNDYVFQDPLKLGTSIAIVVGIALFAGSIVLFLGGKKHRAILAEKATSTNG